MDKRPMTSGAAARAAGVARETISYWVLKGILPVAVTTTTGQRLFDPDVVARLVHERARQKTPAA